MVQINEIEPARFRAGDLITIRGFGFSPGFGDNEVAIDGIPEPIQSESATEITVLVPTGVSVDQYVPIYVFRSDSLGNDFVQAWSKATADDLRSGASRVPGQIPGATEAANPVRAEDVPQAQDYERLVTRIEHLLFDVLSTPGDLFAFDGAGLVAHPLGAAGDTLRANPAPASGMDYAPLVRAQTLAWAGRKLAANTVVDALAAQGEPRDTSTVKGIHLSPLTGNVYTVVVLFAQGSAGDTLDQVIIRINGAIQYDSATGLGIAPSGVHAATVALPVTGGTSTIELEVRKLGTVGDGDFVGHVGVR